VVEFQVLIQHSSKIHSDERLPPRAPYQFSEGTAHLAVANAEQTLCAEPVSGFVALDGVAPEDCDVSLCWGCRRATGRAIPAH
jgi:hypothetical protein